MRRSFLVAVLSFIVGCASSALIAPSVNDHFINIPVKPGKPPIYDWKDAEGVSEITLEREACYGGCPVYKVILRRDGTATYIGEENVTQVGEYQSVVSPYYSLMLKRDFVRLAKLITAQGYFKMSDRYTVAMTDAETVTTSVVQNGQRKIVVNYGSQGPVELYGIEQAIDGVVAQIKWDEGKK